MRKYLILEWNINQATNHFGTNRIPDFVGEEIISKNPDIFTLTEFAFCENYMDFISSYVTERGYDFEFTKKEEANQNYVLIAWKKELFAMVNVEEDPLYSEWIDDEKKPNYLAVTLKAKESGEEFTVIGTRIKVKTNLKSKYDYEDEHLRRIEQMKVILGHASNYDKLIICGDFNNNRRGFTGTWSLELIQTFADNNGYSVYTPEGSSVGEERTRNRDFEFPLDHFITKGIEIKNYSYNRDFTDRCKSIYLCGRDFRKYDFSLRQEVWSVKYGSGNPDHAILIGEFEI